MKTKSNLDRFIRRRLINVGVPPVKAATVAKQFQHSINHMGPVGAVDYWKRVGDTIIWYLYNSSEKPAWVRTQDRFPAVLHVIKDVGETVLLRVAKIARAIRLEYVIQRQVDKVVNGVIAPSQAQPGAENTVSRLIERGVRYYGFHNRRSEVSSDYPHVGRFFSATVSTSTETRRHTKAPPLKQSVEILRAVPCLRNLPNWESVLHPLSSQSIDVIVNAQVNDLGHAVGEIHAAQEGGAKLRMFASPYTVIQCLLTPIHKWIADFLADVPTNCTWNQLAGAQFAQNAIREGRTVHSVDLSTATCRFPFWPQIGMLKLLGLPDEHIIALAWACKGTWRVGLELRQPFQSAELRWEVGQPLGLKPSMSMFSLAHNMLLTGICREKGLEPEEVFRVLGDDVVIVDDGVHQAYLACMKEAGVPVSWNKSHSSSRYAEFAGASITNTSIVRPGQWRQVREGNAVALAETLGTPLFGEVTEMLLKVQKLDLFRKGMFDPPTDEWPCYIRLATLMSHRQLMASVIKGTPFWYYRIMKEYQRQLAPFFGFTSLNGWVQGNPSLIGFTWDEPNVRKTLFQPLRHYLLDDVVSEYHRSCLTINAQYEIVAVRAYSAVASLYERMLISQTEAGNLLNEISEQLRSLLYLPPTGRNVSLNRLVREYRDLLSRAQGCDDETHSML